MSARRQAIAWTALNAALVVACAATALSVVDVSHRCRAAYAILQELESHQWSMQEHWGRLLLEQSTWAAHDRVEQLARSELGMRLPEPAELEVVMP